LHSTTMSPLSLPFFVSRSRSQQLPVYTEFKRGGSKRQLLIRRVAGNSSLLASRIAADLGVPRDHIAVNSLTNGIAIKQSAAICPLRLRTFLKDLGF